MSDELVVSEIDGVVTVALSRPRRRNALTRTLLGELTRVVTALGTAACRGVVLHGADGCFSAGADLTELDGSLEDLTFDDALTAAAAAIRAAPVPVVAAVEGPCVGAAVELAFACDGRVVADGTFVEVPAVRLGILYNPTAVGRLAAVLPGPALRSLLLLGQRLDATALAQLGATIGRPVPRGAALGAARDVVGALPVAPWPAAAATKRLLGALADAHGDVVGEFEAERRRLAASDERAAALAAAKRQLGKGQLEGGSPRGG